MIEAEPGHYEQLGAFYQEKRDRFRAQLLETRLQAAAGARRLLPAGRLRRGQRPADDAEFCRWLTTETRRRGDPAVAVLRRPAAKASAWRGCASPRTRPRSTRRSSG
jgi:methionine transaminase